MARKIRRDPRDPGTLSASDSKVIAVRLPHDLAGAIETACMQNGITASELIRALVSQWAYGGAVLTGPDDGYTQARSMACQLAMRALQQALQQLPADHDEAVATLQGLQTDLAEQRKKEG